MISFELAGVNFSTPAYNAAGVYDQYAEELNKLGASESSAILMKSCTIEPREGNPEPRYYYNGQVSLQAMGLPNLGHQAYLELIPSLKIYQKPVIASVAGLTVEDNLKMLTDFANSDVDLIELNLSCPNLTGKNQLAYDLAGVSEILIKIKPLCSKKPIGLKLPPFYTRHQIQAYSQIFLNSGLAFITCINSIGNTLVIDIEKERSVLKANNGFGGLSGEYIKPIGLANVRMFYEETAGKLPIIGVGGIETAEDIFAYILAGATGVQIGTKLWHEGPECFKKLNADFSKLMNKKGYSKLIDFQGQLRSY